MAKCFDLLDLHQHQERFEVMRKCGDEVWHRLVPLFSGLHCGHDSHASADLLDLHQHQERFDGPTHARKLYRLPGYVQRPACDISARSVVVWTVRNRLWFAVTVVVKIFGKRFTS
jgi:hypothetical protein